jgi:hypothetical protein
LPTPDGAASGNWLMQNSGAITQNAASNRLNECWLLRGVSIK